MEVTLTKKQKFENAMKRVGAWLWHYVKSNYLMFGYVASALIIELTGIAVTAHKFYMTEPWLYFSFLFLVCAISQFLPGHKSRFGLFLVALVGNFVIDLIFIVVFDSTGGTIFDFSMLNLRGDATKIVEMLPFSFPFVFVSALLIALYCTFGLLLRTRMPAPNPAAAYKATAVACVAFIVTFNVLISFTTNYKYNSNDLKFMLDQTEVGTYSNKGLVGNFYNELVRGIWFSEIDPGDDREMNDFIYNSSPTAPTKFYGRAEGYNVVTILCESFEWFTFLYDEELYPNGFAKPVLEHKKQLQDEWIKEHPDYKKKGMQVPEFDEVLNPEREKIVAALRELYPNLYRIYDAESTVRLENSYSLEKTDISENKTIIGNYPLYEYINYAYPENTVPYSIPNILKNLADVESNSFHNGLNEFYNRNVHHVNALGFNSFTSSEAMGYEIDESGIGERNLDSTMFEACKAEMFPATRRFNTYITTITQHGRFIKRDNLQDCYDKLDAHGLLPFDEDDENATALRFYCAAGMDFDKGLGIMLDYLEETGLAENTLITMFGDHNAYYQGLSDYVKASEGLKDPDYTELYRVPVMIKIGDEHLTDDERTIEKFTCVSDIYPTVLDLLGITVFSGLTYGTSAFNTEQTSVLYSRAYSKFLTDKIYFNSMSSILYKDKSVDDDYLAEIRATATALLDKISHVNRIFATDFFKGDNEQIFYTKLKELGQM